MNLFRADRGGLAAPVTATLFEGRAARTHAPGDALKYSWGNEHRDAGELQKICDQMVGVSVYAPHPKVMPAKDSGQQIVGTVVGARIDGDTLVVTVALTDSDTTSMVRAGTRELSLGYMCDSDKSGYQHNTRVDHLAIVEKARCGATCALRVDAMMTPNCPMCAAIGTKCVGCLAAAGPDVMDPDAATEMTEPVHADTCTCISRAIVQTTDNVIADQQKTDAELNAKARNELQATQFAIPSRRGLPIEDEGHVKAAMARFNQTQFQGPSERRGAFHRIVARAHELGIDPSGFVKMFGEHLDDKETTMDEITIKLTEALAEVAKQTARADAAEKAATEALTAKTAAEVEATNARKDAEAEKVRADVATAATTTAVEKARTDAAESLKSSIKSRVALETQATVVLGAADRGDCSDRDIKLAVIKHVDGDDVPTEKPDLYVDGVFEGAVKRHAKTGKSHADARQAIQQIRETAPAVTGTDAEAAAKTAMNNHARTAWMTRTSE